MAVKQLSCYTTGGSIDKYYDLHASDFQVGPPHIGEILQQANVGISYTVHEFSRKDSLDLTNDDRARLRELILADDATHIIVTHGTDTLHLSGQALSGIPDKVIVLTAAMQPAAFKDSDAPFNIGAAVMAVQLLPPGVYLALNGRIFDPFKVRKNTDLRRLEEME